MLPRKIDCKRQINTNPDSYWLFCESFAFSIFGEPMYKRLCRNHIFDDLIDKFARRLESWQAKYLSFGGEITLIKSVLLSLRFMFSLA